MLNVVQPTEMLLCDPRLIGSYTTLSYPNRNEVVAVTAYTTACFKAEKSRW